jgi:hypothetical protein
MRDKPEVAVLDELISEMRGRMLDKKPGDPPAEMSLEVKEEPEESVSPESGGMDDALKMAMSGGETEPEAAEVEPSPEEKVQIAELYRKYCKGM